LQKSGNKHYKKSENKKPGTKITKIVNKNYINLGTKITRIQEQKLQKSRSKNYKNLGTKITKNWEQKYGNKKLRNLGTKIQEQKLKKYGNKNPGTKISKN
jgi:hypothetical protein